MSVEGFPFRHRTHGRVRIVVIDSGANTDHPHIVTPVAGGATVLPDGTIETGSFSDRLGHGTAVLAAIQEKAPDAEYLVLKLFDAALRTSITCLLRAMEWAAAQNPDLVNLSLGTANRSHAESIAAAVEQLRVAGAVLVSARETDGATYFPGCLPQTIGVCLDDRIDRDQCRFESRFSQTVGFASGYPRPIDGLPIERNLNGVSFAVANVSGFLAGRWGAAGE